MHVMAILVLIFLAASVCLSAAILQSGSSAPVTAPEVQQVFNRDPVRQTPAPSPEIVSYPTTPSPWQGNSYGQQQTELLALSNALVDGMLQHKERLTNALSNFIRSSLGNLANTIARIAAILMGLSGPAAQSPSARNAQSGPTTNSGDSSADPASRIILPFLNRPLQYQDFLTAEKLYFETTQAFNTWYKKPETPTQKTSPS